MDLSFSHLMTDVLTLVDETTKQYVQETYQALSGYINGLITVVGTLFIMLYGYNVLYKKVPLEGMMMAQKITQLAIVLTLVLSWQTYHQFLYDVFTNEPAEITKVLSKTHDSSLEALNRVWKDGVTAASDLWEQADWKNIQYYLYAIAVYGATFLNCIYALCLLVYAKMALAFLLAIGPLFLLLMLFQATRELTAGWIKGLFYFALIPVIAIAILTMTTVIAEKTLPILQQSAIEGALDNKGLVPFIALSFLNAFLLKQTLTIAAMLSSSVSLEAVGNMYGMAKNGLSSVKNTRESAKNLYQKLKPNTSYKRIKA